jgi:hypothetical protein
MRQLASSCLSVRPSVSTEKSGSHWKDFHKSSYLRKNRREFSSFIKIGQEKRELFMKSARHFWSYLAQFFLEWEMFRTKVVDEIRTRIFCSITFCSKIIAFMICGKMLKSRTGHRWQYGACALHFGYPRLQTHTRNMQYLWLLHGNNVCTISPHCYVTCALSVLFVFGDTRRLNREMKYTGCISKNACTNLRREFVTPK